MAFSESDRVLIRKFLGFASIFTQRDPRLESAITALQSTASPGGSQPTADAENEAKSLIYGVAAVAGTVGITPGPNPVDSSTLAQPARRGLLQIEASIAQLDTSRGATSVGRNAVTLDTPSELGRLRSDGRRLATQLARMFDTYPRTDAFAAGPLLDDAYPANPRTAY